MEKERKVVANRIVMGWVRGLARVCVDKILISGKISEVVDKRELIDRCLSTSKPSHFIFTPTASGRIFHSLEIKF